MRQGPWLTQGLSSGSAGIHHGRYAGIQDLRPPSLALLCVPSIPFVFPIYFALNTTTIINEFNTIINIAECNTAAIIVEFNTTTRASAPQTVLHGSSTWDSVWAPPSCAEFLFWFAAGTCFP